MPIPVIYLVSTPLHFLVASSLAIRNKEEQLPHLIFIDQKIVDSHPYYLCEKKWKDSPFIVKGILKGVGGLPVSEKLKKRKDIFKKMASIVNEVKPCKIYVGNDRRIEFQYAMHLASLNNEVEGIYMDEGIFTYVGRKESDSFKDKIIDNYLKKIVYGNWWKNPPTIGASEWVSEAYVAFPQHVHRLLKHKKLNHLGSSYFAASEFKELSNIIVKHFSINPEELEKLDMLITLPHESVMARIEGYSSNIASLVERLSRAGKNIGIKYHPRNSDPDFLGLKEVEGVWLIPDGAAFECFLPILKKCIVVGDMSSTLLTTRWQRPDLKVIAIENKTSAYFHQFEPLFGSLGIEIRSAENIVDKLLEVGVNNKDNSS
ncbi:MAG: hypothetical protein KAU29_11780 [Gammaproteobacteria bacterium]|nr:hypothetical protein [Gammaproteobacteria bacterium]